MLDHVLGHGGFRDLDPELQQFTVDSGCAPQRIGPAHSADQLSNFGIGLRTISVAAFPMPVVAKTLTVPANDGFHLNDVKCGMPVLTRFVTEAPRSNDLYR